AGGWVWRGAAAAAGGAATASAEGRRALSVGASPSSAAGPGAADPTPRRDDDADDDPDAHRPRLARGPTEHVRETAEQRAHCVPARKGVRRRVRAFVASPLSSPVPPRYD